MLKINLFRFEVMFLSQTFKTLLPCERSGLESTSQQKIVARWHLNPGSAPDTSA